MLFNTAADISHYPLISSGTWSSINTTYRYVLSLLTLAFGVDLSGGN